MNRAAVDEEDQSEVLKIFELEKASYDMSVPWHENFEEQREHKGMLSFDQHNES